MAQASKEGLAVAEAFQAEYPSGVSWLSVSESEAILGPRAAEHFESKLPDVDEAVDEAVDEVMKGVVTARDVVLIWRIWFG